MSYLVPKDIPNCCGNCPYNYSSLICKITKSEIDRDDEYRERLEDCSLIEIKTPHGRLGDLDELVKTLEQNRLCYVSDIDDESFELGINKAIKVVDVVRKTNAIIEAEE